MKVARPLVAVTRPAGSSAGLVDRLQALGLDVLEAPAILRVAPRSYRPLDAAARALRAGTYGAVAFTSAFAVESLMARHPGLTPWLRKIPLFAVGNATAQALIGHRLKPAGTGRTGGAALARPIARSLQDRRRVLLPRAEEGRDELPEALAARGIEVDVVPAYRTRAAGKRELAALARALTLGKVAVVIAASPSAVEALVDGCTALSSATLLAIGETTAAAARARGLSVTVAPRPTEAALARAALEAASGTRKASGARIAAP